MRGHAPFGSVDIITRALLDEFPELDRERLRAAVERATAKAASASLDTEGYRVVDLHLARAEAAEQSDERAQILRELSDNLAERNDADRALVVRLAAFAEVATKADVEPLLRLARITQRWSDLPLETIAALVDVQDEGGVARLTELATAWQHLGRGYLAADALERVLLVAPGDTHANEALELFYRSNAEWSVLIDLLGRRAIHVEDDKERADLYREIAVVYERELADDAAALDALREADRLEPNLPEVLEAISRLAAQVGVPDDEAVAALERLAAQTIDAVPRAAILVRAADLAKLLDWDRAHALYERARSDDPDQAQAIDGFVSLLKDRGQLSEAITLLTNAAERPGLVAERGRWLADAADLCVALGDTDWAKQLYRDARVADPTNHKAGVALVELCWDTGSLVELAPILDELCRTTEDPRRLRGYLLQRSKVAAELGDSTGARSALSRAVELDPEDAAPRRELGDLLFDAGAYTKARPLLEGLLEDEDLLPPATRPELHYRIARSARETGDQDAATKHVSIALALAPDHQAALVLRTELDTGDPFSRAADQLALANLGPVEEKATRYAALGDRYSELGDPMTAREMYREALAHRPGDHLLLTKFLGLVADDGDWSYSIDLVQRLIDTEQDPKVRARYRHLAAMIARDELDDNERAIALLDQAVDDDPLAFAAADDLESLLANNRGAVASFYYRRLEHVRSDEGRDGERLRLWDKLGELCLASGETDNAIASFEVALSLDPDNVARRARLADLCVASPHHDGKAIALHQRVLQSDKRRIASYEALRVLYRRGGEQAKAQACDDAIAVLGGTHAVEAKLGELFEHTDPKRVITAPSRTLGADDWKALARLERELQLSALFALVAPAFAAERSRIEPKRGAPAREDEVPAATARTLERILTAFGIARPPVYVDRGNPTSAALELRSRDGALVPVLVLGKPLDDAHDQAFSLARVLANLRRDRIARVLCRSARELAQMVELAMSVTDDPTRSAARWLASSLHPVELDQVLAIGARLRERGVQPLRAANDWLAATLLSGDLIGFVVVGDLARCAHQLATEASGPERVTELVWSSVTEDILGVRARFASWSD